MTRAPGVVLAALLALSYASVTRAEVPCPNPKRSQAAIAAFKVAWSASNGGLACPKGCATYTRVGRAFVLYERCGACQVDHVCPLACCGTDVPENMQWLSARANRAKGADCSACPSGAPP